MQHAALHSESCTVEWLQYVKRFALKWDMHHLRNLTPGLTKRIADTKADVIILHQKLLY